MSYEIPKAPLTDAISAIVGKPCPFHLLGVWRLQDLESPIATQLQDWCSNNIHGHPLIGYATGYGVIEAAELLLSTEIENGNLCPSKPGQ